MCECSAVAERWLPVPGWERFYAASSKGYVRGLDRYVSVRNGGKRLALGRILAQTPDRKGYMTVGLKVKPIRVQSRVHTLVLAAFVGLCPEGMEGCHNDGDKLHNCEFNLRWGTPSSNGYDRVRHGRHYQANKSHCPLEHKLIRPNLIPASLLHRRCLACSRARAAIRSAVRRGVALDLRTVADGYYQRIMDAR